MIGLVLALIVVAIVVRAGRAVDLLDPDRRSSRSILFVLFVAGWGRRAATRSPDTPA